MALPLGRAAQGSVNAIAGGSTIDEIVRRAFPSGHLGRQIGG